MSHDPARLRWPLLASIFLVCFSVLAFEVSLTRVFAVLLNYHYAFLAVSGAVCGLGVGGFAWHLFGRTRVAEELSGGWAALAFAVLMPLTILLLFGTANLLGASLWSALLILLPFSCAGAFLAEVFRQRPADSGRLYQADLAGAALAAVLIIPLIGQVGPLDLVFLLGAAAALGALCWAGSQANRTVGLASVVAALLLLCFWPLCSRLALLRLRPLSLADPAMAKDMMRHLADPARNPMIVDSEWTAYARTDLLRYELPEQGVYTLQLFTDGGTPSVMTPFEGDLQQVSYLRDDLPYLAFDLSPRHSLLSIGPGGGMDILWGLLAGFRDIEGVEINDSVVRLMDRYRTINGNLYHRPGVRVAVEDGRSYLRRSPRRYDLISSSLTQTATTGNVGLSLVESYIHTKEAFDDYYRHLTANGRYALVTQSELFILRAANTALSVMQAHGVAPAEGTRHLVAVAIPQADRAPTPYRCLLIWKKSPLSRQDLAPIARAARTGAVRPIFLPGDDLEAALNAVRSDRSAAPPPDLRPATDDHPFFLDLAHGAPAALLWLVAGSCGIALLYALVALAGRPRARSSPLPWGIYFSALGLGFMLVEIPLLQKLILFLGHPTLSLTAILCYLLAGASLGSHLTQRWPAEFLARRAATAGLIVAGLVLAYVLSLCPVLTALQLLPRLARLAVLGVLVLPLGIFLGMPFPAGLRMMARQWQSDIPWMWGLNGMTSVTGSALAAVGAKLVGLNATLLAGGVVYAALALSLSRLQFERATPPGSPGTPSHPSRQRRR